MGRFGAKEEEVWRSGGGMEVWRMLRDLKLRRWSGDKEKVSR